MKVGQTFIMSPESRYARTEYVIKSIKGDQILASPTEGQNHHVYGFTRVQVQELLGVRA